MGIETTRLRSLGVGVEGGEIVTGSVSITSQILKDIQSVKQYFVPKMFNHKARKRQIQEMGHLTRQLT